MHFTMLTADFVDNMTQMSTKEIRMRRQPKRNRDETE